MCITEQKLVDAYANGNPHERFSLIYKNYAYYKMAIDAGIQMNECRIYSNAGENHFMTKRFDRVEGKKIHIVCGNRKYKGTRNISDFNTRTMEYYIRIVKAA